ncbi:MAG: hypothetical protein U0791_11570 [Gemmataceae bacterium]
MRLRRIPVAYGVIDQHTLDAGCVSLDSSLLCNGSQRPIGGHPMDAIGATFVDGDIVPDVSPEWKTGTRLNIEAAELPDDDDVSPEAIAKRLALIDRVEPWMTPEDFAEWERERAEEKARFLANWKKENERIDGVFP